MLCNEASCSSSFFMMNVWGNISPNDQPSVVSFHGYVLCLVTQSCLTLCDAMTVTCQALLCMGILQARILEWVACPPLGDLPKPGIWPRSPALQADSLPSEPRGMTSFNSAHTYGVKDGKFYLCFVIWLLDTRKKVRSEYRWAQLVLTVGT